MAIAIKLPADRLISLDELVKTTAAAVEPDEQTSRSLTTRIRALRAPSRPAKRPRVCIAWRWLTPSTGAS